MNIDWLLVIYAIFLLDSFGALIMSWFGQKWWMKYIGSIAIHFPPARGWTAVYFLLVLIIGFLLNIF